MAIVVCPRCRWFLARSSDANIGRSDRGRHAAMAGIPVQPYARVGYRRPARTKVRAVFAERASDSRLCQEWTAGRMPELPEVETVRRGLALKMTGRRIVRAELRRPDLRRPFPPELAERLGGATIGALGRRGKYILIELGNDGLLLLHLGMSGRITTGNGGAPVTVHDHVVLTLDDGTIVTFQRPAPIWALGLLEAQRGGAAPAVGRARTRAARTGFQRPLSGRQARRQDDPDQVGIARSAGRRRARQHLCLRGALSRPIVAAAARRHDRP